VYPAFLAGWIFQAVMHPCSATIAGSLADAALAFAVGFGALFVCWMFFGMGAGSVKLIGALSIWLGFKMTSAVTALTIIVLVAVCAAVWVGESMLQTRRGQDFDSANGRTEAEAIASDNRRYFVVPFPYILVATVWIVLIWFHFVA